MFGFRPRQYHYIFALTSKLIYNSLTHLCNGIRYLTCGVWAGKLFCLVMIINYLLWCLLEFLQPAEGIEEVPDIGPLQARLDSRDDL